MTASARGTKRRCPSCGAPFYDLNHAPITCPKCHALYVETHKLPVRASRSRQETPAPAEPADEAPGFDEDEVLEPVDDDDEEAIDRDEDHEDNERE